MHQSSQQINQASLRKNNGLFFIKSKHVNPNFKNHSYFQTKSKAKTQVSEKNENIQQATYLQNQVSKKWKMFVDEPKSYGIQNTFKYICNRIRQSKKTNVFLKKLQNQKKNNLNEGREISSTPDKQKLTTLASQKNERDNTPQLRVPISSRIKQVSRIRTEPANKYLMTTQSFNYRMKKPRQSQDQQKQFKKQGNQGIVSRQQNAEHFVQMMYINGRSYYDDQATQNKIILNLLPYILNCFFKCKINYSKKLNQSEYNSILKYINEIKLSSRSYFDVKDIINLSSIQQVFQALNAYGHGSLQWIQTIRYFFMPSEDVLNFQFKKLQDELKIMSVLKFNAQLNQQHIYIYRIEDRVRIQNIYDMLKPGTYIYSENKSAYDIYCAIIKRRAQLYTYKNRIKKWRSVAPLDETQSNSMNRNKASVSSVKAELDRQSKVEKYKRLYEMTRQRHRKNNFRLNNNRDGKLANSKHHSVFIDKSKLSHIEDIFQ